MENFGFILYKCKLPARYDRRGNQASASTIYQNDTWDLISQNILSPNNSKLLYVFEGGVLLTEGEEDNRYSFLNGVVTINHPVADDSDISFVIEKYGKNIIS